MVWDTARKAPIRAYLELEAQPDARIEYTDKLDTARIKISPKLMSTTGYGMGIGAHMIRAVIRESIGARVNRIVEAL